MGQINSAVVGVGNCASSLAQGVHEYGDTEPDGSIRGIMQPVLGWFGIGATDVVADFDVESDKVGATIVHRVLARLCMGRGE